jgi:beta-glucosidase-like glycosyl hydrolase
MQESFPENPILTTRMAVSSILGPQKASHGYGNVAALGKYFAAYGDASGVLNGGA